jgi:hypothetical protein
MAEASQPYDNRAVLNKGMHTATPLADSRIFAYKIRGESKNNLW